MCACHSLTTTSCPSATSSREVQPFHGSPGFVGQPLYEGDPFSPQVSERWHPTIGMFLMSWLSILLNCLQWEGILWKPRASEGDSEGDPVQQKLTPKGPWPKLWLLKRREWEYIVLPPAQLWAGGNMKKSCWVREGQTQINIFLYVLCATGGCGAITTTSSIFILCL